MMIEKPENIDPNVYYKALIDKVDEVDLLTALNNSLYESKEVGITIHESMEGYAYEEGKWNLKQLFQHLVDCERIMSYRALSLARNEKECLLGFDDQMYVDYDNSENRSLKEIILDLEIARKSTISLVNSLPIKSLNYLGNANGIKSTARMVLWFIAAHNFHHLEIVKERYLKKYKKD